MALRGRRQPCHFPAQLTSGLPSPQDKIHTHTQGARRAPLPTSPVSTARRGQRGSHRPPASATDRLGLQPNTVLRTYEQRPPSLRTARPGPGRRLPARSPGSAGPGGRPHSRGRGYGAPRGLPAGLEAKSARRPPGPRPSPPPHRGRRLGPGLQPLPSRGGRLGGSRSGWPEIGSSRPAAAILPLGVSLATAKLSSIGPWASPWAITISGVELGRPGALRRKYACAARRISAADVPSAEGTAPPTAWAPRTGSGNGWRL